MSELLRIAQEAALEAGTFLKESVGKVKNIETKKGEIRNLVSEIDRGSEERIIRRIRKQYPGHAILAEESGETTAGAEFRWIIDPLDGTTNFLHGLPIFSVTIAVEVIDADRSGIAVLENRWAVSYRGVQVRQNLDGAPSRASRLVVAANRGRVDPLFAGFGDGVAFQDPAGVSPEPGATALSVLGNSWTLGGGEGAAASGITASGAGRLRIAANRLAGRGGTGLEVDATDACQVWGNSMEGLDTGEGPDLHLGPATSDCVAIVGPGDVVVDEGSGNRVIRR